MNRKADYPYIFFDLDGTITESAPGIINSVRSALKTYGIEESDPANLRRFIGPPLTDSFHDYYGFSPEKAREAMRIYRKYYAEQGIFENSVYDGIPELLERLRSAGKKLYTATSKPELYTNRILEHFNLTHFFEFAGGSDIDETRVRKADIISYVIQTCHLEKEAADGKIIMIGDRHHDIDGARANHLPSIGILYGYGSREELEAAGATYIAPTVSDLQQLLITE